MDKSGSDSFQDDFNTYSVLNISNFDKTDIKHKHNPPPPTDISITIFCSSTNLEYLVVLNNPVSKWCLQWFSFEFSIIWKSDILYAISRYSYWFTKELRGSRKGISYRNTYQADDWYKSKFYADLHSCSKRSAILRKIKDGVCDKHTKSFHSLCHNSSCLAKYKLNLHGKISQHNASICCGMNYWCRGKSTHNKHRVPIIDDWCNNFRCWHK